MSAESHKRRVRALQCVVCQHMGMVQTSVTEAHHVESVRDGLSDYAVAAVCVAHHTGSNGIHGLSRRVFAMRYGLSDVDLIALTVRQLDRQRRVRHADGR